MAAVAAAWQDTLSAAQRLQALYPDPGTAAGDAERTRWFYTPTDHGGLALMMQTPRQQQLVMRLLATGLSEAGYNSLAAVMGLENVLDNIEGWAADWGRERGRDPGLYWLRLFGAPTSHTWGWRFGGHHVSVNFLIVDGEVVSSTPCFLGADPARSPLPGGGVLGPLLATEELGRTLMLSLGADQRSEALLLDRAPSDIISGNRARLAEAMEMLHMNDPALWQAGFEDRRLRDLTVDIDRRAEGASGYDSRDHRRLALGGSPRGLSAEVMDSGQRRTLSLLIEAFAGRVADGLRPDPVDDDLGAVHFGWAGPTDPGAPHYFRVQGPHLLIEYDNTQRAANHVHSVWRDPMSDFGYDVLGAHLSRSHSS